MADLQLHPGSEPLPEGGDALLERLRTVLDVHLGDEPSDGWRVAIDTCRRGGKASFSVVLWQESGGGQWLGEPFLHSGAHGLPVEEHFAEWLAQRDTPLLSVQLTGRDAAIGARIPLTSSQRPSVTS